MNGCGYLRRTLVIPALLAGAAAAASGPAPLPPAEQKRAEALLHQLGAGAFRERERASRELFRMGLAVKQLLLEGSKDPDPEVRRRCEDLLPAVLEADRRARLEAFLADAEGKRGYGLPGWERFRRVLGNGPAVRRLFADVQRSESAHFLEDVDRAGGRAGELCLARCQGLQQRLYNPWDGRSSPVGAQEVASLLAVVADPEVRTPSATVYLVGNFLYQPAVRSALGDRESGPAFRRLVVAWLRRHAADDAALQYALQVTASLELKEAVEVAVEAARARRLKGYALGAVLTTIGKLGGKEHVAVLEPYLADRTVIGTFAIRGTQATTQVRDVALAMAVHLTGQSHEAYGFALLRGNPSAKFYAHFLGFGDDSHRERAQRKWREWKAARK